MTMVKRRTLLLGVTRLGALLPVMLTGAGATGHANPLPGIAAPPLPAVTSNRAWLCVGRAALAASQRRNAGEHV